ncbi:hypothetical protein [Rhodosalinus sediminis]|uniref:hypothetical protein n=1 Tax=Rhodosalinus sediminis TaxID=1940533 RepID=UPI0023577EC9|nr:hypothetical protein [Rhodosalinus sediminis]
MKALLSTAGALALIATSAAAQQTTDNATVTLNATVADYIAVTGSENSTIGNLEVLQGSGSSANNNVNTDDTGYDKATFDVAANVQFDVALEWATWQSEGAAGDLDDTSYYQAYYYNDFDDGDTTTGCAIGGTIHLDEAVGTGGSIEQPANGGNQSGDGGKSLWTAPDTYDPAFSKTFGVGTEASPDVNNCPGDIAAPGTYSLDVNITVSKAGA